MLSFKSLAEALNNNSHLFGKSVPISEENFDDAIDNTIEKIAKLLPDKVTYNPWFRIRKSHIQSGRSSTLKKFDRLYYDFSFYFTYAQPSISEEMIAEAKKTFPRKIDGLEVEYDDCIDRMEVEFDHDRIFYPHITLKVKILDRVRWKLLVERYSNKQLG